MCRQRCGRARYASWSIAAIVAALMLSAATPAAAATASSEVTCDDRTVSVRLGLRIAGTYCRPSGTPRAIFVLVPGATYNRAYWDFPLQPDTYSFARAAARRGYAVLAIDRLGTGDSSRPLSATLTATLDAATVHDVISHLRGTGFDGRKFSRVLLAGHSLGSTISILEAATYRDVDGVVPTGISHRLNLAVVTKLFLHDFHPAPLDPALASRGLDPGYLTTRPGHRYAAFHAPGQVDPAVIAEDESTKDVFSPTETADGIGISILTAYSSLIEVPVLLANGQQDTLFCGPLAADCSTRQAFLRQERPLYGGAPCIDAVLLPSVGHDINLHPDTPTYQTKVIDWADAVTSGQCPDGP
jgi:pimeloyl-ACP methyl ester carboxylesterase